MGQRGNRMNTVSFRPTLLSDQVRLCRKRSPGLLAKRSELNSVFFKPRLLLLLLHAMSYLIKALGKSVLAHSISTVDQEGVGLLPPLSVVPGTLVDP